MGKKKVQQANEDYGKLDMSSMIDCCFLLLIFFIVNATALTVSKDPSVTMPQATKPTDLEDAKGCIVINVFAPEKMQEFAKSNDPMAPNEQTRINKLMETYKCNDITRIHYGVKTHKGEVKYFTSGTGEDVVKKLEDFIKDEKKALEATKIDPKQFRVYIRADARADWSRTFNVIGAANNAEVPDIVFGSLPAKK
ncbi:MAG: biopolymer transporter ExbD [Akkermansia sp.]|nr:biopolymer transporter ExbD [Akkermansia sp.]